MEFIIKILESLKSKKKTKILILFFLILLILGISFKVSSGVSPFVYFNF